MSDKRNNQKEMYIGIICEATGWSVAEAELHMKEAKKIGLSNRRYVVNKCWNMTSEEIEDLYKRIKRKIRKKEHIIKIICEATGWNSEEAESHMKVAKKLGVSNEMYMFNQCWDMTSEQIVNLRPQLEAMYTIYCMTGWEKTKILCETSKAKSIGISIQDYTKYCGWEFTECELEELGQLLELNKCYVGENREWHAKVACEKSNLAYEEIVEKMNIAIKKGYTEQLFVRRSLWEKSVEELNDLAPYKPKISKTKKKSNEEKEKKAQEYREIIKKEMGWTSGRTRLEALRSTIVCGSSEAEFYLFKIYKNGIDKGKEFITEKYNRRMNTRYAGWDGRNQLFQNKALFNEAFKDYVHRRWFLGKDLTFEKFKKQIEGLDKIICKPLNGIEGIGIEIFTLSNVEEELKTVYDRICEKGETIVEQFLTQHSEISMFYPKSVNTIRVMSFLDNGEGKILNAVIKFGTTANVDNYYQGGIAAGIDEKTGVIRTEGVDYKGNLYSCHPYSAKQFKGFQIPHWDKVVETIRTAAMVHKDLPYIGWDVAITQDGPEIIEGNHNQGAYLCQYPFAVYLQEGRKYTIDSYLEFDK